MSDTECEDDNRDRESSRDEGSEGSEGQSDHGDDDGKGMSSPPLTHEKERAGSADQGEAEGEQEDGPRPSGSTVPSTQPIELGAGRGLVWGGPAQNSSLSRAAR